MPAILLPLQNANANAPIRYPVSHKHSEEVCPDIWVLGTHLMCGKRIKQAQHR